MYYTRSLAEGSILIEMSMNIKTNPKAIYILHVDSFKHTNEIRYFYGFSCQEHVTL